MDPAINLEQATGWNSKITKSWPHAPRHYRVTEGCFMVTSATYEKVHFFNDDRKLRMLQNALLQIAMKYEWHLQAWAVFANHYHFIGIKENNANTSSLDDFMEELHGRTSRALNKVDGTVGRKVWFNYWESVLTYQNSYNARLNYVHQNAVKHGLVPVANQYPYCSASWFAATANKSQVATIYSFEFGKIDIPDDF